MADNVPVTAGVATYTAATDKVTYSGDASVDVQLVKPVSTTGAEGSKTVVDLTGPAGTPSAAVITVQGSASGTPQPVSLSSVPSHAVTNAGTFAVQAGQTGTWTMRLADGGGTTVTDTTAHAVKSLFVDAAGLPIASTVGKTTDTITAALDTSTLQNGTTSLTPQWVVVTASSSGHNVALAAVTAKKIRVLGGFISASAAVNVKFKTAAAGADISNLFYFPAAGTINLPFNPLGWFETVAGDLLSQNLSGAVAVSSLLQYVGV